MIVQTWGGCCTVSSQNAIRQRNLLLGPTGARQVEGSHVAFEAADNESAFGRDGFVARGGLGQLGRCGKRRAVGGYFGGPKKKRPLAYHDSL